MNSEISIFFSFVHSWLIFKQMKTILDLFEFGFFRNAFLAALLASIICGIIGTYIVSRKIVFISGGITHASFGGIGLGYFLGLNPLMGATVFSIVSALSIEFLYRKIKVRQDSAIAMLWSLGMALGIIFVYLTPGYAPNLMSYLFGNILTVTATDLWLMLILAIVVLLAFFLFFQEILFIAFDEAFAKTRGLPVKRITSALMVLVALTIVLNIRVVGIILVISLLSIPQATANLFTQDFRKMIPYSILFSFIGTFAGLLVSFYADIPSGAAIIFTLIVFFFLLKGITLIRKKRPLLIKNV